MAANPHEGVVEYVGFAGLRNTVPPEAFEIGDLTDARNVDVDNSGRLQRRKGSTRVSASAFSSIYSDGNVCLAVRAQTELVRLLPNESIASLRTGLTPGLVASFVSNAGRVYYSNSMETGVVDRGVSRSWGLTVPPSPGSATQIGGTLRAGRYQFAVVYKRSDGQLSGASPAGLIDLSATGGMRIDALPVSTDPDVAVKEVYVTDFAGETLYRRGTVPNSATSYIYQVETPGQVPLTTQFLSPPPSGHYVQFAFGRTFVAVDDMLFLSEPFAPELFDLRKGYRYGSRVHALMPAVDGVYLGTETAIIWHAGTDPHTWSWVDKTAYGMIPGTATSAPADWFVKGQDGTCIIFASTQGVCVGFDGGNLRNITQDRFLYPVQDQGAGIVRKHRGINQYLVALQGNEIAAPAAD